MSATGYECTAYFNGRDGLGTCDTGCQWWTGSCPKAKGSPEYDGQDERPVTARALLRPAEGESRG